MALIKQAESSDLVHHAVVLDLGDLRKQADELLALAAADAEQIRSDALAERERIMAGAEERAREAGQKAGHEAGFAEGREVGRAEAIEQHRPELNDLLAAWNASLDQFQSHRVDLLEHTRQDMLAFVVEIASRVTKSLVELDDTTVLRQLEAALPLVIDPSSLQIEVHPGAHDLTQAALPDLLARFVNNADAQLTESDQLSPGSCVIRTTHGRIDATIDHQIQRIAESLLGSAPQPGAMPQNTDHPEENHESLSAEDRSAA
jgi:flagellar assembly protein FliH